MKIHRVVQMLGATTSTGKLAEDMYDLGHKDYYSEAKGTHIPISHMDFQHMVRAFVKLTEQEEVLDRSKHMGRTKDLVKTIEDQENKILGLTTQIENLQNKLNNTVSLQGCGYVFSEIPNDTDGQEFVDKMKKYFNKISYKMRVRGQHIKPELKGTGATYWGQTRDESTHIRIYIDAK